MVKIPTVEVPQVNMYRYRTPPHKGVDYAHMKSFPNSIVLNVSPEGMTPQQFEVGMEKLAAIERHWLYTEKEGQTLEARARAHTAAAKATAAEVAATNAWTGVAIAKEQLEISKLTLQGVQVDREIKGLELDVKKFQLDMTRFTVPLKKAEAVINVEGIKQNLYTKYVELMDVQTRNATKEMVLGIQGVNLEGIERPQLTEFSLPEIKLRSLDQVLADVMKHGQPA